MKVVDLFDADKTELDAGFHIIFVLDESGSMSEQGRWGGLCTAYVDFLNRRVADQGAGDVITVIQFDDSGRTICAAVPIAQAPRNLSMRGNGTNFGAALAEAEHHVASAGAGGRSPVMIFMSDGDASPADDVMKRIFDSTKKPVVINGVTEERSELQVHVIAFGAGANTRPLEGIANACGANGKFHSAADNGMLSQTFKAIASGCSAMDGLINQFGQKISEQVANKLFLDYL